MAVSFAADLQKARRRHDLLLCLLVPCMLVLWVGGLSEGSPEELANGYSELLYSVPVIHAIMLPVLMSVLASRLWDMENRGNMQKLLYTLQSRRSLFVGKVLFGGLEIFLVDFCGNGGTDLAGNLHGYTGKLSRRPVFVSGSVHAGCESDAVLLAFLIVLFSRNSLPALCVGIVGALLGLFSAFLPPIVSYFLRPGATSIPLGAYEVADWRRPPIRLPMAFADATGGCWHLQWSSADCCCIYAGAACRDRRCEKDAEAMYCCRESKAACVPRSGPCSSCCR